MSILSIIGKFFLALVVIGIVIGGAGMYFFFIKINPEIDKLSTLDKINYELEEQGQDPIAYNPLTGEMVR